MSLVSEPTRTRLERYLGDVLEERVEVLSIDALEGGWSRAMHRVRLRDSHGDECLLALRGEVEASVLPSDCEREWRILDALDGSGVPLPDVYAFESSSSVLGYRFMVMEWVDGIVPNPWRSSGRGFLAEHASAGKLGAAWIEDITCLHRVDPVKLLDRGLDEGVTATSYLAREVREWWAQILSVADHPGPLVEEACEWLADTMPPAPAKTCVVHGDLRIGNMMVRQDRIVAFLDWEMAGLGDWRADVGYCLMPYNCGKFLEPTEWLAGGLMHPRDFLGQYLGAVDRTLTDEELVYFMVLGCVKMIAIFCAGIDTFVSERSRDPRFPWLSIPLAGMVEDIDVLLTKGLPW